jgi:hypothetical protein
MATGVWAHFQLARIHARFSDPAFFDRVNVLAVAHRSLVYNV